MTRFVAKRIYDPAEDGDGYRVLVDRLWPRGVSKERAALDEWCREVSPSPTLRTWFGHVPERFAEFAERYRAELAANDDLAGREAQWRQHPVVTVLFGARDRENNEAVVLVEYLEHEGGDAGTR